MFASQNIKILAICVVPYLFLPGLIGTCAPDSRYARPASRQETLKPESFRPDVEVCVSGRLLCSLDRFRWLLFDWNVDTYTAEMAGNKTKGSKDWRDCTVEKLETGYSQFPKKRISYFYNRIKIWITKIHIAITRQFYQISRWIRINSWNSRSNNFVFAHLIS